MTDEQIIKMQAQQLFVERQRIAELERQLATAKEDTMRLDWLEEFVNENEALVLHTGSVAIRGYSGLGLRPEGLVRTLRETIDKARSLAS